MKSGAFALASFACWAAKEGEPGPSRVAEKRNASVLDECQTFKIMSQLPAASESEINSLQQHFGDIPSEYLELVQEATELELLHRSGQYIRIWSPGGCIEMELAYGIRQRIRGAFPIGDDGGGRVIFFADGERGWDSITSDMVT